jgi:Family of unknown function (DUF6282)
MQISTSPLRDDWALLRGAVDIHIHHGPDLYPRIQDPIELAQDARAAGVRAVCIKRHNFPTAALAEMAHKAVPEVDVFGSLACNREVGGLNPSAVEAAIKYGARQIWLPTIDSTNHEVVTGTVGQHGKGLMIKGGISEYARKLPRIYVLDNEGTVVPHLKEIIQQIADADIILNLGHTSFPEMTAVLEQAKRQGVKRVICDHPFFLRLGLEQQLAITERGAWMNFTAGELLPRWWRVSVDDFAKAIRRVGVRRAILSSDCGQIHNPPMVEALRLTCQLMLEEGFSVEEIKVMLHHNPAELLYP